jgi:hypothetical protein
MWPVLSGTWVTHRLPGALKRLAQISRIEHHRSLDPLSSCILVVSQLLTPKPPLHSMLTSSQQVWYALVLDHDVAGTRVDLQREWSNGLEADYV